MLFEYTQEERDELERIRDSYKERMYSAHDSSERAVLSLSLGEEIDYFNLKCMQKRIDDMHGDHSVILADAKDQATRLPIYIFNDLTFGMTENDLKLTGVFTEKDGTYYIKASVLVAMIREELQLHITALGEDQVSIQELYTHIADVVEKSDFADDGEIVALDDNNSFLNAVKYRQRDPLATINYLGISNTKVTRDLIVRKGTEQLIADGQISVLFDVELTPQGKKPVYAYVSLTYNGEDNIKTSKKLTEYDKAVYDTIATIYYYNTLDGRKGVFVTLEEIWRAMNGKDMKDSHAKPSEAQIKRLRESIDKMRFIRLQMDIKNEINAERLDKSEDERFVSGFIDDSYLDAAWGEFKTNKGNIISGYLIRSRPILHAYSALKNQLLYVPYEMLDTSSTRNDSEYVTEFKSYLLQQIQLMINATEQPTKNGKRFKRRNRILIDTIYEQTGVPRPEDRLDERTFKDDNSRQSKIRYLRKADREKLEGMLTVWQSKKYIKGFKAVKEGSTVVAYDISV